MIIEPIVLESESDLVATVGRWCWKVDCHSVSTVTVTVLSV